MNILEDFVVGFFQEIIVAGVKYIGAFFRWILLRKKYTYKQVYNQDWNTRVGLLAIALIVILIYLMLYF